MRCFSWLLALLLCLLSVNAHAAITCQADDSFNVLVVDNFTSSSSNWRTNDFDRAVSNWPGESIYNTPSQAQSVFFNFSNNRLTVAGSASSGNDNEYGMVEYALPSTDTTRAGNYSISTSVFSNSTQDFNNDLGIVFGYQDDANYYLARWTKFGASAIAVIRHFRVFIAN